MTFFFTILLALLIVASTSSSSLRSASFVISLETARLCTAFEGAFGGASSALETRLDVASVATKSKEVSALDKWIIRSRKLRLSYFSIGNT